MQEEEEQKITSSFFQAELLVRASNVYESAATVCLSIKPSNTACKATHLLTTNAALYLLLLNTRYGLGHPGVTTSLR